MGRSELRHTVNDSNSVVAAVIRERFRVKRQVRVVTAHARMTGWVLVALPVALALVLTGPVEEV